MFTIADSIGIKLISHNCLLTGIGNELHQYYTDVENKTIHRQINLNFKTKIYGITSLPLNKDADTYYVVVYAGRDAAVLSVTSENEVNVVKKLSLGDWISSIRLYKLNKCDRISFCVLSAHSVATEIEVNDSGEYEILNSSSCIDKVTLYCSMILGDKWLDTTLFGGTAFGELIIWTVGDSAHPRNVIHRLAGHNGVIFSIDCSLENNLLTTTSDDRSVKIWNLKFQPSTSFDWSKCILTSSKSMFGHTARIFKHKIIEYNGKVFIVSIGEEGNVCVWTQNGELVCRELISSDLPLWNLDYDPQRQNLLVCGRDGNVHQMHLKPILDGEKFLHRKIPLKGANDEFIAKIAVLQANRLLIALTNHQHLYYCAIEDIENNWIFIKMLFGYKSTLLESNEDVVATAGYQYVNLFRFINGKFQEILNEKLSNGLIRSLKFVSSNEFVICDDKGNCRVCTFAEHTRSIEQTIDFDLPACKERWITVAFKRDNYILVGDRCGHVHLYELNNGSRSAALRHTLKNVHGNLGCTSIYQHPTAEKLIFKTAGHDGTLKLIVLNESKKTLEIQFTYSVPIVWCDKILSLGNDELLLAGFNDNHFVLWQTNNNFRFEFECGGGHRYWDLQIDTNSSIVHLFYIRAKTIHSVRFDRNVNKSLSFNIDKSNWHSRPCNIVRTIRLTDDRCVTVSGGDDNLLIFNEISVTKQQAITTNRTLPQHIVNMVLHISNIRTIYAHRLSSNVGECDLKRWLIFSAGGRAQICATEIQFGHQRQQSLQFREISNFMLRSSDFQRKRLGKSQIIDFDPETRFMSLISFAKTAQTDIYLAVGCSDGYIRCFSYMNGVISLYASTFYGRCILHVHHLYFKNRNYLLSMATDGLIVFWDLDNFNDDSKPLNIQSLQHHDSGINSFDVFVNDKDEMYLATGGDDQAIVLSIVHLKYIDDTLNGNVLKTIKYSHKHSAQVNGIKFSADGCALYTAGVDQRVIRIDLGDFKAMKVAHTCVSDAKGIEMIANDSVLVYGCGVQLISVLKSG